MLSLVVNNKCDLCRRKYHYHYLDLPVNKTHLCEELFNDILPILTYLASISDLGKGGWYKNSSCQTSKIFSCPVICFPCEETIWGQRQTRGFFKATKKCQSRSGTSLVGPVVKNLPSNAGDVGSIPGQGIKTPHGKGKLSHRPQVLILSPCTLEPLTYNEREDCTPQQSLLATAKTQCNQINK